MKKLLALLLLFGTLQAASYSVNVDPVYFKPTRPSFYYTNRVSNPQPRLFVNRALGVRPSYAFGLRIGGRAILDCPRPFGEASMLFYKQSNADHIHEPENVVVTKITGRLKYNYRVFDAMIGQYLQDICHFQFYALGGVRNVYLKQEEEIRRTTVEGLGTTKRVPFHQILRFRGTGPFIGVGGESPRWRWGQFQVRGEALIIALFGKRKITELRQFEPSHQICIPATNLKLGLRYTLCVCGGQLRAEGGYELQYYFRILKENGQSLNLGFGGPYASFSYRF